MIQALIHLFFSPGVGNGPIGGIPEPSTWAMLLLGFSGLGFSGLGFTGWRRRAGGKPASG